MWEPSSLGGPFSASPSQQEIQSSEEDLFGRRRRSSVSRIAHSLQHWLVDAGGSEGHHFLEEE